jgi:hypothetical protein
MFEAGFSTHKRRSVNLGTKLRFNNKELAKELATT